MSDLARVVQYGIDVLVRNDIENKVDIQKVLIDALERNGFYVCGISCEGLDDEYPGLDGFLSDAIANSGKYAGSVPPSHKESRKTANAETHEEVVVRYLKRWGHPHPDEDGMLEEFMDGGEQQWMYDEAVLNDYALPDVDRWFCLVNTLGAEISFDAAMVIEGALYEEDLDAHEFECAKNLLNTPRGVCGDMLRASLGMADSKGLPEDIRLVQGDKDLEILRGIFEKLLEQDLFERAFEYFSNIDRNMADYRDYLDFHKEKLIYCYQNNMSLDLLDVDFWVQYEKLLGEQLSFNEYAAVDGSFDGDPHDINDDDAEKIERFRDVLNDFRNKQKPFGKHLSVGDVLEEARNRSKDVSAHKKEQDDLGYKF